ncbi:hypothetical protein H257_00175 [Aphanomyces astaci]|uniref:Uncharacterized protein n=1 Tax=Aphanomyces astaci TaxID=112090 RepID=W4HAQ4_APHAT|nr:hypothetical protein H257_00175 [Aphanomyces astaci]ETV88631.1 hypothetical protein H257_00175 [Aphanomyces astaci]|eukprot:XP_009821031.1 hypothetical protein H257_00175 [Aphanomyces astaci]
MQQGVGQRRRVELRAAFGRQRGTEEAAPLAAAGSSSSSASDSTAAWAETRGVGGWQRGLAVAGVGQRDRVGHTRSPQRAKLVFELDVGPVVELHAQVLVHEDQTPHVALPVVLFDAVNQRAFFHRRERAVLAVVLAVFRVTRQFGPGLDQRAPLVLEVHARSAVEQRTQVRVPKDAAPRTTVVGVTLDAKHQCRHFVGTVLSPLALDAVANVLARKVGGVSRIREVGAGRRGTQLLRHNACSQALGVLQLLKLLLLGQLHMVQLGCGIDGVELFVF